MTLYRIGRKNGLVQVLYLRLWQDIDEATEDEDNYYWKNLKGSAETVLISDLNPRDLGLDGTYRYVVTDEP